MSKIPQSTLDTARSDIHGTIDKYIDLVKKGDEYSACCPFHKEKTPSFSVVPDKGFYYCHGCGAGGNAIDFVMEFEGVDFREAVERIVGNLGPQSGEAVSQRVSTKTEKKPEWETVSPVPESFDRRPMDIFRRKKGDVWEELTASRRWEYRDVNGDLIGYVFRFDLPGGGKDVMPQSCCVNLETGEMAWRWKSFAQPRPMYGLEKLARHPNAQVMLLEGEKACDAGQAHFEAIGIPRDKLITLSWPGGGKAASKVDWSPLDGRNVGMWPDADQKNYGDEHELAGQRIPVSEQPGVSCMLYIATQISERVKSLKIIEPPTNVPDGWDLADEFPEGFSLLAHVKASAFPVPSFLIKHPKPQQVEQSAAPVDLPWDGAPPAHITEDIPDAAPIAEQPVAAPSKPSAQPSEPLDPVGPHDDDDLIGNPHFTVLGFDGDDYFFFQHEKRQVLARKGGQFSESGLQELAPITWWEFNFAGDKGMNRKMALEWIFRTANSRGIYDPSKVRGRGAWTDKGRAVYHHGSYLTVDGAEVGLAHIKSGYIYPMARDLPSPSLTPLTDAEGARLIDIASLVRFSMAGSAALMAGFCMLAPICGALMWRPHIWLTGPAGSGKSTVQNKFCAALLRDIGQYYSGDSTEAGIRQDLKADALPVLIDEAESNNEADKQRMEKVVGLIRKTSTESQMKTAKGTVSGTSQHYQIRSMFCLASINVNLPTKADIDRLTVLAIKKKANDGEVDNWVELEAALNSIEQDETISSRLLARSLGMIPVILEAIKVFRRVAAKHFGNQRDGDQFGTLLAGTWCLKHSIAPTELDAELLIEDYVWDEHTEDQDQDDSTVALSVLLNAKIRMGGGMSDKTVFELVRESSIKLNQNEVDGKLADQMLRQHGVIADHDKGWLVFGTSVPNLKELVAKMPAITDLRSQLLRIKDSERWETASFLGSKSKRVAIPLGPILGEVVEEDDGHPF